MAEDLEMIKEMIDYALDKKAISIASILEVAKNAGVSVSEVGATFSTLLAFAIAWADERIQEEEKELLEKMKAGTNLLLSEPGRNFHNVIFESFLSRKPDSASVEFILEFFREAAKSDYWKSTEGRLLGAAMFSGFYELARVSGYPTQIAPPEENLLKRIAKTIGIDYNEFRKLCDKR